MAFILERADRTLELLRTVATVVWHTSESHESQKYLVLSRFLEQYTTNPSTKCSIWDWLINLSSTPEEELVGMVVTVDMEQMDVRAHTV